MKPYKTFKIGKSTLELRPCGMGTYLYLDGNCFSFTAKKGKTAEKIGISKAIQRLQENTVTHVEIDEFEARAAAEFAKCKP